jgi:hypothetical protein
MSNQIEISASANCQTCGCEYLETDLSTVKLAGFDTSIIICKSCLAKAVETSFKDAADIIGEIISIAKDSSEKDPEIRLRLIKALLQQG